MSESVNLLNAEMTAHKRLKVSNPRIVVSTNNPDKPVYGIIYYDVERKKWCHGFGSYYLENVQKWFNEELEVIEMDFEPVIRCQDCTVKKAVQHKDGIVWRCPHRTGDVKMEGYCESGAKADGTQ